MAHRNKNIKYEYYVDWTVDVNKLAGLVNVYRKKEISELIQFYHWAYFRWFRATIRLAKLQPITIQQVLEIHPHSIYPKVLTKREYAQVEKQI